MQLQLVICRCGSGFWMSLVLAFSIFWPRPWPWPWTQSPWKTSLAVAGISSRCKKMFYYVILSSGSILFVTPAVLLYALLTLRQMYMVNGSAHLSAPGGATQCHRAISNIHSKSPLFEDGGKCRPRNFTIKFFQIVNTADYSVGD